MPRYLQTSVKKNSERWVPLCPIPVRLEQPGNDWLGSRPPDNTLLWPEVEVHSLGGGEALEGGERVESTGSWMGLAGFTNGNVILLLPREPTSPLRFRPVGPASGLRGPALPVSPARLPPPQAGLAAGSAGEHVCVFLQKVHYPYSQKKTLPGVTMPLRPRRELRGCHSEAGLR